jgi:two-component system OmpR family response regulator
MQSILIIEDEKDLADLLAYNLEREGFRTFTARDGLTGLDAATTSSPDLIILDLMLPGMAGTDICRHLKKNPKTAAVPVIMLTARGDEIDRVVGFEIGADDYVVKPFEPRELVARIKSVLRRSQRTGPAPEEDALYEFEGWRLDPVKRRLTDPEGALVSISAAEFRLLCAFLTNPRKVMDRDRLLDMVQGREAHLFDRAVDNQVSRLRRKIEADSREPRLIQTVRGGGYVLAADVRRIVPDAGEAKP